MSNSWLIEDERIVHLLRAHGFACEKPLLTIANAALISTEEADRIQQAYRWYNTTCPIEIDGRYTLPDGTVLQAVGTNLQLVEGQTVSEQERIQQLEQLVREQSALLQECWSDIESEWGLNQQLLRDIEAMQERAKALLGE